MIVYNKDTGKIISEIPDHVDPYFVLQKHPMAKAKKLATLMTPDKIRKIKEYYVENGELKRHTELELEEIYKFRKILTLEERTLNKLKPSCEEVKKAQNTIEILTLIQEVI